jgi:pimeloyl-ACP methyl ester carboxylesterase
MSRTWRPNLYKAAIAICGVGALGDMLDYERRDDGAAPVLQSRRMNAALKAAGKRVDYVEVSAAGHADWEDDIERSLMRRYVSLLAIAFA